MRLLRHKEPILIIPYYVDTREEEIVETMCENYNENYIKVVETMDELYKELSL